MRTPYTRIPQWFFGLVPELTEPELKVMLVIYRHTLGWNRDVDNLSYSQLQEEAGIGSRNTISKVLKNLEGRGLITRQTTRITAQRIQVYPLVPILPSKLVHLESTESTPNVPPLVHLESKKSARNVPPLVHSTVHTKETTKESFKETNNIEKFTPEQEESLTLLVGVGVSESIGKRLISLSWERGRDISYIKGILGYVAEYQDVKNPAGMVVSLIERNNNPKPLSNGQQGPKLSIPVPKYHLYDSGGPELESHSGPRENCPICRAEGGANELS